MPRVQVEEQDYIDNPDDPFPQIVPENDIDAYESTSPSYLFWQQPQQPRQIVQPDITNQASNGSGSGSGGGGFMLNGGDVPNSSANHFNRLAKSSSHVNFAHLNGASTSPTGISGITGTATNMNMNTNTGPRRILPTSDDELNDTIHYIKGRGVLASTKDVMVSPVVFAEGCKLLQAAALGNVDFLEILLTANPKNIHFRDYDRRTALHVAASEGQTQTVKLLIEKYNAPINRSDRWGGSPLDDAHRHRHADIVSYLRKNGGSTGSTDQTTNLITAAVTGDLDEIRMLLTIGDNNNNNNNNNISGISNTIGTSDKSSGSNGKKMISSSSNKKRSSSNGGGGGGGNGKHNTNELNPNVNINAGDYDKRTALHLSAAAGHIHVVSFLIRMGANINCVDSWGATPLDDAIRTSNLQCIRIIKENGGKVGMNKSKHLTETSQRTKDNEDKNLNIDFSELDVIDKIGSGAFGEIFKCRWRGTLVAAKCIKSSKIVDLWRNNEVHRSERDEVKTEDLSGDELEEALADFRLETSILRTLRHPNICMLLGYSHTDNFEVMISELMKCSLLDVFSAHMLHGSTIPRRTQIIYAQQLARGMNYLHQCKPPVIHRDLKPANLLIDFSGTLKITDFGLAKVRPDPTANETDSFRMTGETGSYRFMAPEVFRHEEYTETVDIYSFAMIFYYLISGRPPWETLSGLNAVIKAAVDADRPIITRSWDNQISSLMQRCWDENPTGRPSFSVILNELRDYSKNVLKMDIDNAMASSDLIRKCCCVIS